MAAKTVYVEIVAQTKRFNQGLKKADAGLARLKKGAALAAVAVAAIGGIAVREALRTLDEFAGKADDLAKMAKATGVTAQAIQKLGYAMNLTGGDSNTLQKGIITLQDRIGQASQGSVTYQRQLKAIGLNWKELVKLSPTEQLLAVTDALRQTEDLNTRSAAGSLLLGRAYKSNAAFFAATRKEIEKLTKEAGEIGTIDQEVLEAAEAFEDAKEKVELLKMQLTAEIFREFGPQLTKMREDIVAWWKALGDEGKQQLLNKIILGLKLLGAVVGVALVVALGAAIALLAPFALIGAKVAIVIGGLGAVIGSVIYYWDDLGRSFAYVAEMAGNLWNKLKDLATGFGGEVLSLFGFGGDDSLAQSAGLGASLAGSSSSTSYSTANVSIDARGMTPEQVNRLIAQQQAAAARGKGR